LSRRMVASQGGSQAADKKGIVLEIIQFFIELLRDPRSFIAQWINDLGSIWVYIPLTLIIFCETGLVVTPFLPGDSLLFTAGVFAAPGGGLNVFALIILMSLAAILGNTSNYWIGRKVGKAIISSGRVKSLTPERIAKTQAMFDKYGLLAVVLTRFFPFIRTFAPFLAGVGGMHFGRFTLFNVIGGLLWVTIFTLLGYYLGSIPFVQDNFELIIIAIVVISFLPTAIGLIRVRMSRKK
jgi:membrane-associated protein